MRAYTTTIVATALGVSRRWVDAVIASGHLPGLEPDRQGKSRAITPRTIVIIAVANELATHLGASLPVALNLAIRLVEGGRHQLTPELSLEISVSSIERRVTLRLADAVEANPPARRGRPPARSTQVDRSNVPGSR